MTLIDTSAYQQFRNRDVEESVKAHDDYVVDVFFGMFPHHGKTVNVMLTQSETYAEISVSTQFPNGDIRKSTDVELQFVMDLLKAKIERKLAGLRYDRVLRYYEVKPVTVN